MVACLWLTTPACGPEVSLPAESIGATGEGETGGGGSDESTGSSTTGHTPDTGDSGQSSAVSSGSSSSGGAIVCEAAGGEDLDLGTLSLSFDGEPPPQFTDLTVPRDCLVADVVELTEELWEAELQCSARDLAFTLRWHVAKDFDLLDPTWVGRSLSFSASTDVHVEFSWYALRDARGELLCARGSTFPPAEATAPFTVGAVDLGETCPVAADTCYLAYDQVLTFTSDADGTLECYDGRGYVTDTYVVAGEARDFVNPDPEPFGDCPTHDRPSGVGFTIVRRP